MWDGAVVLARHLALATCGAPFATSVAAATGRDAASASNASAADMGEVAGGPSATCIAEDSASVRGAADSADALSADSNAAAVRPAWLSRMAACVELGSGTGLAGLAAAACLEARVRVVCADALCSNRVLGARPTDL